MTYNGNMLHKIDPLLQTRLYIYLYTVEPLYNGHLGTKVFVRISEVSLFQGGEKYVFM